MVNFISAVLASRCFCHPFPFDASHMNFRHTELPFFTFRTELGKSVQIRQHTAVSCNFSPFVDHLYFIMFALYLFSVFMCFR